MSFIKWLQTQLYYRGYDVGPLDGIFGRRSRNALVKFQRDNGLRQTGVADDVTVALLRERQTVQPPAKIDLADRFPWMAIGLTKKGLIEDRDNKELREFLKSDGKTLGDPAKLPWCGDYVETCIAVALPDEILPNNPYLARNWTKFGKDVKPSYGAVMAFWRGTKTGTSGHVAFYYAEDATHYHVLGGNQSNSVSVTRIARNRLLAARMPLTGGPYPAITRTVAASGEVSENEA